MKLSTSSHSFAILCTRNNLIIFSKRSGVCSLVKCPQTYVSDRENNQEVKNEEDCNVGCAISRCEKFLTVITSSKRLLVWSPLTDEEDWTLVQIWTLYKRPTDVIFDDKSENILVADKTGNVLRIAVPPAVPFSGPPVSLCHSADEEKGHPLAPVLLGHLSILLSLCLTPDGKHLITADRDEKIKVSHYPLAHNIESFCLGHSEFVAHLSVMPSTPSVLLSAAGDGAIKLWDIKSGANLHSQDTHPDSAPYRLPLAEVAPAEDPEGDQSSKERRAIPPQCAVTAAAVTTVGGEDVIAVSFDNCSCLVVYNIRNHRLEKKMVIGLPSPASTFFWIDGETLATVCQPLGDAKASSVLVWQVVTGKQLTAHNVHLFCSKNSSLLEDMPKMDTKILYKERYDNMAEYQKKKQERIESQELKRLKHESQPNKRLRMSDDSS